jgi:hypothetical protein
MTSRQNRSVAQTAGEIKAEIRRLVLARSDLQWAATLLDHAAKESDPERGWRLWEAATIAYARPFKAGSLGVARHWQTFPNADLTGLHNEMIGLRDKVFAHNDRTPHREVALVPPDEAVEVRIRSVIGNRSKTLGPKKVVNAQLERIEKRIVELAKALSCDQGWEAGVPIPLRNIGDKLQLHEPPSPFQIPKSVRPKST